MNEITNPIPIKYILELVCIFQNKINRLYNQSNSITGKCIGKSYDEVIEIFKDGNFQNDCIWVKPELFMLEIRRESDTLSYVFTNFRCTEAYIFNDNKS